MALRRVDQLLSSLGYASRREVAAIVARGRVMLGDRVVERADERVDASLVTLDDEPLEAPDGLLAVFHKPCGYVCTRAEDEGLTVHDLLPPRWSFRNPAAMSVGRLDKDTSGLLLITDQGTLVQRFTSPKSSIDKVYEATMDRDLDPALIAVFASGTIMLRGEEKPCLPATLEILAPRSARLTITEGRYHQVRRMFASLGWHVETLHRSRFGPYELGDLTPGSWRLVPCPAT